MSSFRLLLRIVLATLAILACGAFTRTGAGPRAVLLAVAIEATELPAANAEPTPAPSDRWRDLAPRVADLKAVESDVDDDKDDKDPRCDLAGHGGPSGRCIAATSQAAHPVRGELPRDTSCFDAGNGLPRGPPV